ncbi:MAG: hypothetical protein ACJ795_11635, partial [Ktedonobacteraceae bacterium]
WFAVVFLLLLALGLLLLWYSKYLVFNDATLQTTSSIAMHIDFALLLLLAIDIVFFIIADALLRLIGG